jgi:hypothetical protein
MSSEQLHAPRERLSKETLAMHHAIVSLIEELEAVDWYRQRADDCEDPGLKAMRQAAGIYQPGATAAGLAYPGGVTGPLDGARESIFPRFWHPSLCLSQ